MLECLLTHTHIYVYITSAAVQCVPLVALTMYFTIIGCICVQRMCVCMCVGSVDAKLMQI